MSINKWIIIYIMYIKYIFIREYYSAIKKNKNFAISMDGFGGHRAKWNKSKKQWKIWERRVILVSNGLHQKGLIFCDTWNSPTRKCPHSFQIPSRHRGITYLLLSEPRSQFCSVWKSKASKLNINIIAFPRCYTLEVFEFPIKSSSSWWA